jgi:hypothetical protein
MFISSEVIKMLKLRELIKSRFLACPKMSECVSKSINNIYEKAKGIRHKFTVIFQESSRRIRGAH